MFSLMHITVIYKLNCYCTELGMANVTLILPEQYIQHMYTVTICHEQ